VAVSANVSGGTWLSVSSSSGSTPATLTVSVNPAGLQPGNYSATVNVGTPTGNPTSQTIGVTLAVTNTAAISANPTSLTFTGTAGGSAPANETIAISGTSAINLAVSVTGAAWLSAQPATGTTPATVTASVNPAGLAAGTYNGNIVIAGTGANTLTIPVTLTLASSTVPTILGIRDGAGFSTDPVAPGSIISIFGTNLGPNPYVSFTVTPANTVDSTLADMTVTVDGTPAIPLLAYANQVNAIVPYSAKTSGNANVVVTYKGQASAPFQMPMTSTSFKLFTANAQGNGPAAALNQDYTVNTATAPANKGSVVQLFGANGGAVNPPVTEGGVAPVNPLSWVTASYSATVNGAAATVLYAGTAPGLVFGVYQVNVQLPANVATGSANIVVTIGSSQSQTGVTVFVK
jgi:uncharacterized protein (TIGR03437 family)